jgi:hypothetical protein
MSTQLNPNNDNINKGSNSGRQRGGTIDSGKKQGGNGQQGMPDKKTSGNQGGGSKQQKPQQINR